MAAGWEVIRQESMTVANPAGGFYEVIRVTFRTAAGVVGHVDVPRADYTVDNVRAAIEGHAGTLDAVAAL